MKDWKIVTSNADDPSNTFSTWLECGSTNSTAPSWGQSQLDGTETFVFICQDEQIQRYLAISKSGGGVLEVNDIFVIGSAKKLSRVKAPGK